MSLLRQVANDAASVWFLAYHTARDEGALLRRALIVLLAPLFFLLAAAFFVLVLQRREP